MAEREALTELLSFVERLTFLSQITIRMHLLFGLRLEGQPYKHTTPTTPQDKTPTTPSTSKREDAKLKRLRTLLSTIGENGASLKVLMEAMQRKDRKGFVSTYITPNIETGYIGIVYTPSHLT